MDVEEHFYSDNPTIGHPDVITRLSDVDYFFVGNGHVHAAVQVCRSGEGTPLGLLVMDPGRFGPKRAALTLDPESGLRGAMVGVRVGDSVYAPDPDGIDASWGEIAGVPAVRVEWQAGPVLVVEMFHCPDRSNAKVCCKLEVRLPNGVQSAVALRTDRAEPSSELLLEPSAVGSGKATLVYDVLQEGTQPTVAKRWEREAELQAAATGYWGRLNRCWTGDAQVDRLFAAARNQLPVAVDAAGRMDGSIWQYNLEWVRDQAHVAEALVRLGDYALARTMLSRLLDQFVSTDGDTVDSGTRRAATDVELDQNGELLAALRTYFDWTGDVELVESQWPKVRALATFPLRSEFRHLASGLLHNRREYWERHAGHGIQDGFELMHQFFVVLGLESAAYLAAETGRGADGDAWLAAAAALRRSFLEDTRYRLIENGHLIKRRGLDGAWQRSITAPPDCGLPRGIPLLENGDHYLDPDTSCVLPIAYEFVDPKGELARDTLSHVEQLWNQRWDGGGYGRYHASSEADSAGAWPFPSLFVARAYVEAGDDAKVWRVLRWLANKPGGVAGTWFEFDGPRIAPPYPQVGVTPWTWAELITLYVHHLLGVRPDRRGVTIRPRLLAGLNVMDASLLVRGRLLKLKVRRAAAASTRSARVGAELLAWDAHGIRLPLIESDIEIEIEC